MKLPHVEDYDRPADAFFAAIGSSVIEHAKAVSEGTITETEAQEGIARMTLYSWESIMESNVKTARREP